MSVISSGDGERDEEVASLYRSSMRDEPPPALDAAIRAAAHRAVGARPKPVSAMFRRWQVPFSIAAVVVVSASLVMVMREEAPDLVEPPHAESPLPAPATRDATQGLSSPESEARRKSPANAQEGPALGLKPPREHAAPSIGMRDTEPTVQGFGSSHDAPGGRDSGPPTAAMRAPAQAFPGTARPSRGVGTPSPRGRREELERSDGRDSRPAEGRPADSALEPRSPAPASAAVPSVPEAAESKSGLKSENAKAADSAREEAGPRAQTSPRAEQPLREMAGAAASDAELPPEKWLERIGTLRREGRIEAARASFTAFRRRYPAYPLPAALKDWDTP